MVHPPLALRRVSRVYHGLQLRTYECNNSLISTVIQRNNANNETRIAQRDCPPRLVHWIGGLGSRIQPPDAGLSIQLSIQPSVLLTTFLAVWVTPLRVEQDH